MKTLSEDLFRQAAEAIFAELCNKGNEIEARYLEVCDEAESAAKVKVPVMCKITLMPVGDGIGGEVDVTASRGKIHGRSTIGTAQQPLPM